MLVILGCCNAGAALNELPLDVEKSAPTTRVIEYLLACSADKMSGGEGKAFHDVFITVLKKMSGKRKPFSVFKLHREMVAQAHRWKTQQCFAEQRESLLSPPVYSKANDEPGQRQILLKPFRPESQAELTSTKHSTTNPSTNTSRAGIEDRSRMFAGWKFNLPCWLRRYPDPY